MGREVELKLQVPPSAIDEVARLPWLSEVTGGPAKREKLVTVYFDTAKSKLRKHGLALRVRHSGSNRLQTIKALRKGDRGPFGRDEWEERIADDKPNLKLAKGTALEPLATKKLQRKLRPVFETVVERAAFPIRSAQADLELAVDRGHIEARECREPVSEIEIELKHGDRGAIATIAERLAQSAPVAYEAQSKPERGYALSAGQAAKAVCRSAIDLDPEVSTAAALQTIALSCLDHTAANERAVREGRYRGRPPDARRFASATGGNFDIQRIIAGSRNRGGQDGAEMAHRAACAGPRFRRADREARQERASRSADPQRD
jgi:inorganic triphosphatase YgiF